jgi:hypothetical protein
MSTGGYDSTENVTQIIESTIKLATPRDTFRGRKDRNRLVKQVMVALKKECPTTKGRRRSQDEP